MKEKYRNVLLRWGYIPPSGLIEKLHALRYQVAREVLDEYILTGGTSPLDVAIQRKFDDWLYQQEEK